MVWNDILKINLSVTSVKVHNSVGSINLEVYGLLKSAIDQSLVSIYASTIHFVYKACDRRQYRGNRHSIQIFQQQTDQMQCKTTIGRYKKATPSDLFIVIIINV